MQTPSDSTETPSGFDPMRRYVRVLETGADGFVSFEFAIGWPDLAVELLLPVAAFEEFCATHRVTRLAATATASREEPTS